jgi:DNA-binding transcriptional ArsR family regulator
MEQKNQEIIVRLANTLSLLGEPTRLGLVVYLMDKEACVSELTEQMAMSQPSISHHLRLLKDARILKAVKRGKMIYYSINDEHVKIILAAGLAHMKHGEHNGSEN